MPQGISIREFAKREGVSDTLVRKAVKLNRLKAFGDKSIDPALVGTAWRAGNVGGASGANPPANSSHPVRTSVRSSHSASADEQIDVPDDVDLPDAAKSLIESGAVQLVSYAEALQRKENYLGLLRRLEYEQKSGTLIELTVAQGVLFDAFRAQRDAWLNWPTRVGPLLAAHLGIDEADRLTEALTAHVHKQIADLGEPDGEFATDEA